MPIIEAKKQNRITGLDMYRIIACLMVFINHCNSKVMLQVPAKSMAWFVTVAVVYITKIAVPGFFMISGYNLLHRQDGWDKAWLRIRRILVDILVFSLFYYIWKCISGTIYFETTGNALGAVWSYIWGFVSITWTSPMTEAYWYLYVYLGLMIALPYLQKIAAGMTDFDFYVMFGVGFVFVSLLPMIAVFVPSIMPAPDFNVPIISASFGSVLYMFVGHFYYIRTQGRDAAGTVHFEAEEKNIKNGNLLPRVQDWMLVVGVFVGFALNMLFSMLEFMVTEGETFLSMSAIEYVPLALESVCLFTLLIRKSYSEKATKVIEFLSPATFGVYLLADFMCTNTHMIYYRLCIYMNRLFAVAIEDVCAIVITFAVVLLLRMIPGVKKWI